MSEARKCDRCHGFYEIPNEQQDKLKPYDVKGAYAKLLFCDNNRDYPETVRWYDLCPKCVELLDKWLENPDNYDPNDLIINLSDTACTDRSNGATEKELELASKLNDAKIYIAQLKSELGYTMTKEEMDSLEARGFKEIKKTNDNTEAKRFCNFDNCKFCSSLIRETLSCEPGIAAIRCARKHKRLELRGANPNIIDAITPETFDEIDDPELSDPYEDGGL